MSKRYMDFVPKRANEPKKEVKPAVKTEVERKPVVKSVAKPVAEPVVKPVAKPVVKTTPVIKREEKVVASKGDVKLGVIEDLGAIEGGRSSAVVEKPVENSQIKSSKTFTVPKSPFINQNKVEKRPLSKNVYQKKVEPPKEVPKGPVTIIAKPEKDAHVGLVVAVILTIILGAAAGTIAYLLLPK